MSATLNTTPKNGHSSYTDQHCPHCNGTGRIPDWRAIGMKWKLSRVERRIKLGDVAKSLGLSATYISMLEHGKKPWPARMEFKYLAALKAIR